MERRHPEFALKNWITFLLVLLLRTSTQAQEICSSPSTVDFRENNTRGDVVAAIDVHVENVTLRIRPPSPPNPNIPFVLNGSQLIATEVLDYEDKTNYVVNIICRQTSTGIELNIVVVVLLINVNDNPPVFAESQYHLDVPELSRVDSVVGTFPAKDLDQGILYYSLLSEPEGFAMQAPISPNIVVQKLLDYDTIKSVKLTLYAQDTPNPPPEGEPSFTATTSILVTIVDIDNRPPWFQPCTMHNIDSVVICQGPPEYTGSVVLTEQEIGALPLKPGPLYAIDGDFGIDEKMTYTFLSGNDAGLFEINANTGNITMLRVADIMGPINLTVLATQKNNKFQFATTKVTIKVVIKSPNPPQFENPRYEGFVSEVGTMVLDLNNKTEPLWIQAKDADFAGGFNPAIAYKILGSSDFSFIGGYLFMTRDRPLGTVSLEVEAVDMSTGESAETAILTVEVTSGLPTTSVSPSTTDIVSTTLIEVTTGTSLDTSETDSPTTNSSLTTEGSISTASTAQPHTEGVAGGSGDYRAEDMAILGASLAVLLLICLVVVGLLVYRLQRSKADWRKISEASIFRNSLGQGGRKEGIHYTNKGFQNDDEDAGSMGSSGPDGVGIKMDSDPGTRGGDIPFKEPIMMSTAPLPDNTSLASSDNTDNEKEVKPILTKERRMEEGYKSVWFKEDIDPNAKEEVVIIPDNREQDSEEEEEQEEREEGEEEEQEEREEGEEEEEASSSGQVTKSKVLFADTDIDSGQIRDSAKDSEDDEMVSDL